MDYNYARENTTGSQKREKLVAILQSPAPDVSSGQTIVRLGIRAAPHGTLDPRAAVEQLQFLVRAVRQRLVRQPEVDRDARFRARAHERVEDHKVVQLYGIIRGWSVERMV